LSTAIRLSALCHFLAAAGLALAAAAAPLVEPGPARLDPSLAARFRAAADGRAAFLAVLAEQADLAAADRLLSKEDKGRFVVAALRETAARSQRPLLDEWRAAGIEARSFWVVNAAWARGDAVAAARTAARPDVRALLADDVAVRPLPLTEKPPPVRPLGIEWGITAIRAPEVWSLGYTGQGVVIAGQDTGYAWNHPALKTAYRGWDGTNADHNYNWHDAIHAEGTNGSASAAPWDDHGHGTHTMGTMIGRDGANQIGAAPGARWIGCRNMAYGDGTYARYLECFEWLLAPTDLDGLHPDPARAPDVMNNSWVFTAGEGCTNADMLRPAVEACRAAGIVVVASAGNEGPGAGTVADPPAIYAASFTVGAVDSGGAIAGFSSRGPVTSDGSGRRKPDICAPGVGVRSGVPGGGYAWMSGTSMAGPHVAGTVALVLSAHPGLRGQVEKIETLLERTAVPYPGAPDNTYGWGRVDALAAVGLADTDADGIEDWWENVFGLNPTNALDAAADPDGDGLTTGEEWVCNTDPTNASSVLCLDGIAVATQGTVSVTWRSRQDGGREPRVYTVYASDTPAGDASLWDIVQSNVPAAGDWTTAVLPGATNGACARFYRVGVSAGTGQVFSAAQR
jgi:subtilisin family serine protease